MQQIHLVALAGAHGAGLDREGWSNAWMEPSAPNTGPATEPVPAVPRAPHAALRSRRGRWHWWLVGLLVAGAIAFAIGATWLVRATPSVEHLLEARDEKPSVLLAADGSVLATFRRTHREWIRLADVPSHVVDALIATEDHRFWEHPGVDWRRSLASVWYTLRGDRQGGSTITQQLARNFFPEAIGRAPTASRKLKELVTALKIERAYGKREILETYLNTVPFHYNAFGLEMAARTYFNKPARALDVAEGATLIGMLKGTRAYNPVLQPERARERRNVVLAQMQRHGRLDEPALQRLAATPLRLRFARQDLDNGPAPHFADAVRRWLLAWSEPLGFDLFADGLVVHSTLDPRLQALAQQAVSQRLDALQAVADVEWSRASPRLLASQTAAYVQARRKAKPFAHFWASRPELQDAFIRESPEYTRLVDAGRSAEAALVELRADDTFMQALRAGKTRLEAGLVALDPATGQVRAWVGSRDHALDAYDHVQQARRQPGSTFKPFVYAAALEAGIDAQREFAARPVSIRLPDGSVWRPRDAGGSAEATGTLDDGLVYSRNSITAQVMDLVGPEAVARVAQRLGVRESSLDAVPSLALGTSPVSLLEMASAYGTIATLGAYRAPQLITRVTDRHGRKLLDLQPIAQTAPERVLEPAVAQGLIDMMRGVVERGTGRAIREAHGIDADVAGKTGTTQNGADGWFVLMHPRLVVGAWVGFNDPRVTLRSDHWGQGAHTALPVVGELMRRAIAQGLVDPSAEFPARPLRIEAALRHMGQTIRRWFGLAN